MTDDYDRQRDIAAEGQRAAAWHYKRPVCRGSYMLGTACGRCERCEEERARLAEVANPQRAQGQGWQCPVCRKVHAPFVAGCDCHKADRP